MTTEGKFVAAMLVVLALIFGAAVAWGATNLSFSNTFTLSPGEYCLQQSHSLTGNVLNVITGVTDGACTGDGETITVVAEATPTPTPEPSEGVPAQCAGMEFEATIVSDEYGVVINGTSKDELIIAKQGGTRVNARGGNDCISIVDNSRAFAGNGNDVIVHTGHGGSGYGENGRDHIYMGTGSLANGGNNTDTCEVGAGSGKVSCEE